MLDRMLSNATFVVEAEYEEPREGVTAINIEYWFVTT